MIRLIDDTIDFMNTSNNPGIMLAVDYRSAFDSISKEFMIWVFKQFGFEEKVVQWVKLLIINYLGWISESFPANSGTRQGCPFSPMSFIIALELLAIKIRADNNIKGLQLPIPHYALTLATVLKILMYADDITLFLSDRNDLERVLQLITAFSIISNLEMNKK